MKFYITTSIAYTNAYPHIGFALELLQADVIARHKRRSCDVFFLTGTDEHGTKIAHAAKENGMEPREFVEDITGKVKELTEKLCISNDDFICTTDKEKHWPGVFDVWKKLSESGDIYKKHYKGLYCKGCEEFKRKKDLVEGKCVYHDKEPQETEEENYFFRLSRYKEQIKRLIESDELRIIPESRKKEILSFMKEGLEDVSISRSRETLSWGIPVPGDDDQTIYVWVDALTNYISALGYGRDEELFSKYWPCDVHCVGKDILRFHALIWTGMLLSAGITPPREILVHGFITVEGRKMSKSLGNVIDPLALLEEHHVDAVRYFFLREVPVTADGDFSESRFKERYNADLADGLGNLLSRSIALANKKGVDKANGTQEIKRKTEEVLHSSMSLIDNYKLNEALEKIWELIHFADRYIERERPWEEGKEEVVESLLYMLLALADMIAPFMPWTSEEVQRRVEKKEKGGLFPKT